MDRKLDKPAYKPAISPGPPLSHTTPANSANLPAARPPFVWRVCLAGRLNPRNLTAPKVKMYEGLRTNSSANYAKRTQSCPPFTRRLSGGPADSKPLIWQRITKKMPNSPPQKQTQNEPKRTQSKPNFSPKNATQSQNEPKRTQANPTCRGEAGCEAGTNPISTAVSGP